MTKDEMKNWILENIKTKKNGEKELDLSGIDLSGVHINFSNSKAKRVSFVNAKVEKIDFEKSTSNGIYFENGKTNIVCFQGIKAAFIDLCGVNIKNKLYGSYSKIGHIDFSNYNFKNQKSFVFDNKIKINDKIYKAITAHGTTFGIKKIISREKDIVKLECIDWDEDIVFVYFNKPNIGFSYISIEEAEKELEKPLAIDESIDIDFILKEVYKNE